MGTPVDRLPAQRPRALLEGLEQSAERARRGDNVELPQLTLFVAGGHAITGRFVAYKHDAREGGSVVLHATATQYALDVVYVPLETIGAVMVHHRETTIANLSGGKIAPKPKEIPGKLVLERSAAALSERYGKIELDWESLGNTDESRAAVAMTLDALPGALDRLLADDFGKSAWKEKVDRVRVQTGDGVSLQSRVLALGLAREGAEVFPINAADLERSISGLL